MRIELSFILVLAIFVPLRNGQTTTEPVTTDTPEVSLPQEGRALNDSRSRLSIATWIPPRDVTRNFPYYLSGYDLDSRPVYIVEMGRWDVRSAVEKGGKDIENLRLHFQQLYYRISQGGRFSTSKEEEVDVPNSVVILDWVDYNLFQLASNRTLQALIKYISGFEKIEDTIAYGFFINVNYVAETLIRLARPLMSKTMKRIETYGTQRNQWMPKLLEKIPRSQLPSWYGGDANFRAVALYG